MQQLDRGTAEQDFILLSDGMEVCVRGGSCPIDWNPTSTGIRGVQEPEILLCDEGTLSGMSPRKRPRDEAATVDVLHEGGQHRDKLRSKRQTGCTVCRRNTESVPLAEALQRAAFDEAVFERYPLDLGRGWRLWEDDLYQVCCNPLCRVHSLASKSR